jgi:hypothetical protein
MTSCMLRGGTQRQVSVLARRVDGYLGGACRVDRSKARHGSADPSDYRLLYSFGWSKAPLQNRKGGECEHSISIPGHSAWSYVVVHENTGKNAMHARTLVHSSVSSTEIDLGWVVALGVFYSDEPGQEGGGVTLFHAQQRSTSGPHSSIFMLP